MLSKLEKLFKFKINKAYCISIKNNINGRNKQNRSKIECKSIEQDFDFYLVEKNEDPVLGCLNSHIECIKDAKVKGYKRILMMEDDVQFNTSLIDKMINDGNVNVPEEFDMFYPGYHVNRGTKHSESILKLLSAQTTHCYIMDCSVFDYVLDNIDKNWTDIPEFTNRNSFERMTNYQPRAIDLFYSKWVHHRRMKSYGIYPIICNQHSNYSEIEGRNVDYKELMRSKSLHFYHKGDSDYTTLVVNLKRRPDRWKKFIESAKEVDLKNYIRFDAIDGKNVDLSKYYQTLFNISDFSCCYVKNPYQSHGYQKGVLGCAMSHVQIWNLIEHDEEMNDMDFYLVLEDDITFCENYQTKLNNVLDVLKKDIDWDVTYLGFTDYNDVFEQDVKVHPSIIKFGGGKRLHGGGTFAYLIRKKSAKKLLKIAKDYQIKQAIDWFMIEHFDKMVFYKCEPELIFSEMANNKSSDSDIQNREYCNLIVSPFVMDGKDGIYYKDQYNNYYSHTENGVVKYNGTFVKTEKGLQIIRKKINKNDIMTDILKDEKKKICFYSGLNPSVMTKNLAEIFAGGKYDIFIFNDSYDIKINKVQYIFYEKFGKFSKQLSIDYLIITDITFFLHFSNIAKKTILWDQNLLDNTKYNKTELPNSAIPILHNVLKLINYIVCPSVFSKSILSSKSLILKNNNFFKIIPYHLKLTDLDNPDNSLKDKFNIISFDNNLPASIKFFEIIKKHIPQASMILYSDMISSDNNDNNFIIKKRIYGEMLKDLEKASIFITYENSVDTYYNILLAMKNGCITVFNCFYDDIKSKGITYSESLLDNTFIEKFISIIQDENKRKIYVNIGKSYTKDMIAENIRKKWTDAIFNE